MQRRILLILAVFACVTTARAQCGSDLDLSIIRQIESGGNPRAYNPAGGGSYGLYQINPKCLRAYNRAHYSTISLDSLYDGPTNRRIARWYISREIPRLLRHYGLPVDVNNKIICYNAGIRYLAQNRKIPAITEAYIRKYWELCEKRNGKPTT